MAEYINREDAEEVVTHFMHSGGFSAADFIYAFGKIPVADVVERKKGKWVDSGLDAIGAFGCEYRLQKCSECEYEYSKSPSSLYFAFCPRCGAEMEGE